MKSLIVSLALIVSSNLFAAQIELGKYRAIDAETKSIVANFELKANGSVNFKVMSPDLSSPVACEGRYGVRGNTFNASLSCDSFFLSEANVEIDITNVNPTSLRTEKGVPVAVIIDAIGSEPNTFLLKKVDTK